MTEVSIPDSYHFSFDIDEAICAIGRQLMQLAETQARPRG